MVMRYIRDGRSVLRLAILVFGRGVIIDDAGEYKGFIEQSNPNQHDLYNF